MPEEESQQPQGRWVAQSIGSTRNGMDYDETSIPEVRMTYSSPPWSRGPPEHTKPDIRLLHGAKGALNRGNAIS